MSEYNIGIVNTANKSKFYGVVVDNSQFGFSIRYKKRKLRLVLRGNDVLMRSIDYDSAPRKQFVADVAAALKLSNIKKPEGCYAFENFKTPFFPGYRKILVDFVHGEFQILPYSTAYPPYVSLERVIDMKGIYDKHKIPAEIKIGEQNTLEFVVNKHKEHLNYPHNTHTESKQDVDVLKELYKKIRKSDLTKDELIKAKYMIDMALKYDSYS